MPKQNPATEPKPKALTAWWWTKLGEQIHISDLIRRPELRDQLALLDRLAFELELNGD